MWTTPGDLLLRPLPIAAVILVLANDRWFKRMWPSWWTGKLSDLAGLALLPFLIIAVIELSTALARRPLTLTSRGIAAAVIFPALAFAVVKLMPQAADAYGSALGWLRAPTQRPVRSVHIVHDATDLLAIAGSVVAWVELVRISRMRKAASRQPPCR